MTRPCSHLTAFANFWIGLLVGNLRIKFEVCIFSHSVDRAGSPKFGSKSRSRDVGHAPLTENVVIYVTFYKFDTLVKFRYYSFINTKTLLGEITNTQH